jgi:hypothetical protein
MRWAREAVVGVRAHPGCGRTMAGPTRHCLAPVGSWLGLDLLYVGARPKLGGWMGLCLIPWCMICITLSLMAYFDYNSIVFQYKSYKIVVLQYKWNYANSKGICVKSMFISPILDYNWRSDLVVSDRQDPAPLLPI